MSIIRAPRPQSNFYLLDKRISEDKRLSWAARGLLVYLLGKPDNWKVSVQALVNETALAYKSTGRDAVYNLLSELQQAGYAHRRQMRLTSGLMGEIEYHISEEPLPENPEAAPLPEKPDTADPDTVKPTLVSTDEKQGLNGKQGLRRASASRAVLRPEGVSEQTWDDFLVHRKALGAAITQTGLNGIAKQATAAGWTLEAALAECCAQGWRGFKADWVAPKPQAARGGRPAEATPEWTAARNAAAKRLLGFHDDNVLDA